MSIPKKKRLYFIADGKYRTISLKNGVPVKNAMPTPLRQNPSGWKDISIGFSTNIKYFSLNRSFSIPLTLVNDGADIVRWYMYEGKGYEEELYLMILAWSATEKGWVLEYRGKIDMSKNDDDPETGLTITTVEGGVFSYLDSNETVTYQVPCDETNPDAIKVLFDGITLQDKFIYSVLNIESLNAVRITIPMIYLRNEGDSTGVISGNQDMEFIENSNYLQYAQDSNNYAFKAALSIDEFMVTGDLSVRYKGGGAGQQRIKLISSKGKDIDLLYVPDVAAVNEASAKVNVAISLQPDEKLFVVSITQIDFSFRSFEFINTSISFDFKTKAEPTTAWALRPLDFWKGLGAKATEERFAFDSELFRVRNNIVCSMGDAIRNTSREVIKNYYLKTSIADFIRSYNSVYGIGLKVVDDVAYLERKGDIYQDNGEDIMDLGEVSGIKVKYATDLLFNVVNTGAPNQDYDERNGKYESNTTTEWKLPSSVKNTLDLTSKYRQDPFGIEFIRAKLTQRDSTDNEGDDQIFMINISDVNYFVAPVVFSASDGSITIANGADFRKWFFVGDSFIISDSESNNGTRTVSAVSLSGSALVVLLTEPLLNENAGQVRFTFKHYLVKRENYASITGVLDNTVYNTEEMTPARQLRVHGDYIRGALAQSPNDEVTFQKKSKNNSLVTIDAAGNRIAEADNVVVNTLAPPLFLPYYISFKTEVEFLFAHTLSRLSKGHVKIERNGHVLYLLPIGEMKGTPATNEAQEWKLLLSPKTSLTTLRLLSTNSTVVKDDMKNSITISDYNPLHFVKYNYQALPKYHHLDMYDELFEDRNGRFAAQPYYLQKVQTGQPIPLQFITAGMPALTVQIIDQDGRIFRTYSMSIVPDPAVTLPYSKQELIIDTDDYPEGKYAAVLSSDSYNLAISQWYEVAEDWPKTYLLEYYSTKNELDGFFSTWRPCIRVEALFMPWVPDGSGSFYEDEGGSVDVLSATPFLRRKLYLGDGYGIPDWMINKLNKILFLDRVSIEGERYSRWEDSKFEATERVGYPCHYYAIDLRRSISSNGLSLVDSPIPEEEFVAAYTIEGQAFGMGEGVFDIEITED